MRKLKILYVTGMSGAIEDIWKGKTEEEITHGYQFFQPWYLLARKGHQVDFIIASNFDEPFNIKVDWFSKDNIYANIYDPFSDAPVYKRIFRRLKRLFRLFYYTNKAIRENHYDFIYGKAFYEGLVGNILANIYGIPCGIRSMGTQLPADFERWGVTKTALYRPAEYITFKLKKKFILMTDDGTRGDYVYDVWGPKKSKYDYLFWKTGVRIKDLEELKPDLPLPDEQYLFFAARFDHWKRHDRVLKILKILHDEGCHLHLYLAGNITLPECFDRVNEITKEYGLENFVHYLGGIKQDDLRNYAYHAVANPSMYDMSNLGNVFFETFSVGAVIVAINDGTLNDYLSDKETGFLVNSEEDAASTIRSIAIGDMDTSVMRKKAVQRAKEKFINAEERYQREADLIERYALEYR